MLASLQHCSKIEVSRNDIADIYQILANLGRFGQILVDLNKFWQILVDWEQIFELFLVSLGRLWPFSIMVLND